MTPDSATAMQRDFRSCALVMLSSLVAAVVAISSESLWIDEAFAAKIAMQHSFADWWSAMLADRGSNLQMPLYLSYLWLWEKLAGQSEWALRLANLPWFLLAQTALWFGLCHQRRLRNAVMILTCASPFLWFYLNEARPYVMQYAAACMVIGFLAHVASDARNGEPVTASGLWLFVIGELMLCGSSALGVPYAGSAGLAGLVLGLGHRRIQWSPNGFLALAAGAVGLGLLGYYYLWTAKQGASPALIAGTNFANLVFAAYELFGFAGLGPPRLKIRELGLASFKSFMPYLGLLAFVMAAVLSAALPSLRRAASPRLWLAGAVYVLLPMGFIFALGMLTGFRVLGRHFAPFAPVVLIVCGVGLNVLLDQRKAWARVVAVSFPALWLISALSLRYCALHHKDDYRTAAEIARSELASGRSVWWAAEAAGADYYHLPLSRDKPAAGNALELISPSWKHIVALPPADVILLSKTDLFDANGVIARFVAEHDYTKTSVLPAFTIWKRGSRPD